MRYWPLPSVTAVRTCSISAGLRASTVTPGRMPPVSSETVPPMVCALAAPGASHRNAAAITPAHAIRPLRMYTEDLCDFVISVPPVIRDAGCAYLNRLETRRKYFEAPEPARSGASRHRVPYNAD